MKINEAAIKKLATLLDETGLSEIEVVEGEQVIRVSKGGTTIASGGSVHAATAMSSSGNSPRSVLKLLEWVSKVPNALEISTNRTPASTNRRASNAP